MFLFATLLFGVFFFRLWLASFGGIHPDEAYYWVWAQDLKMGYFDHPPMIAWVIRLGQSFIGLFIPTLFRNEAPVYWAQFEFRFLPYALTNFFLPLILALCIERIQKSELRVSQMFVIITAPVFVLGSHVITPDTPFFVGWALALYFVIKFQRSRGSNAVPGDPTPFQLSRSIRMGIILAFCAYSKYSAALCALLFVFTGAGFYNAFVAALVSVLLFIPHLQWNLEVGQPQGAGIFFQLANGLGARNGANHYNRMGDLILSQIFLWTPPIFLTALLAPLSNFRKFFVAQRDSQLFGTLWIWSMGPVFFFGITALKRNAEANWPLVGFMAASVFTLAYLHKRPISLLLLCVFNLASVALAVGLLSKNENLIRFIRPLSEPFYQSLQKPSRLWEFDPWDKPQQILFEATKNDSYPIEVESYQILSKLKFYDAQAPSSLQMGPRLVIWPEGSRKSEYNMNPRNLPPENYKGTYWLLTYDRTNKPNNCRINQVLLTDSFESPPYSLYLCAL